MKVNVMVFCRGDKNAKGSILKECKTKKEALQYLKEWLQAHSTKLYPFKKDKNIENRYESKFQAVYLEAVK